MFCIPARGNEKPRVEKRVRVQQRQWVTPVPRCADLDALNVYLRGRALAEAERTVAGYTEPIRKRFALDRAKALPLPAHRRRRYGKRASVPGNVILEPPAPRGGHFSCQP